MRVLAGDIGGTKTSLAIFEVNGTKLESLAEKKYPSGDYSSLDEIVKDFVKDQEEIPQWGSFGIAGPVRNGIAKT
ncbi:MAG: glucokinase, partial [Epsilonproteobacteria bacterium]